MAALIKNATKFTVVGGAVYWSATQGVWGTCDEGAEVGRRLTKSVWLTTLEQTPKVETVQTNVLDQIAKNWNAGITFLFNGAANLPDLCKNYSSKIQETIKELASGQKSA
ncbi:hypothetical protein BgiMline_036555 [Biomphalaria glabrata]|nr:MICOS complex subunit MIC13-like isoform X2 [Biomphalaria glabrata]KAI8786071.1 MICOS complex subunit MIC13 isoform X2 [Biomphalaria glabrata]